MTTKELLMKYENQWVFLSKEQIDYMLNENKESNDKSDFEKPFIDFAKQYVEQLKSKQ